MAAALAVGAAIASSWVAANVFERIPHLEDEFANLWEAEVMAKGHIALPSPRDPRSFMVPFVVDYQGERFGKYPPGWPAALSLGAQAGLAWMVNPLLAGLSAWLIFRLGSKVGGLGVGLVAELLSVTSPMFLMLSGSLLSHSLSLFLALAFALAWLDLFPRVGGWAESGRLPAWMLVGVAGLSLGLSALTRPMTALGVALPFAVDGVRLLLGGERRTRARLLGVGGTAALVTAILLLWQWALTGKAFLNPYVLWWPYDKVGFGPGFGRMPGGHSLFWASINTRASLRVGLHDLFGWPYLSWLLLPFGLLALRRNRAGWLLIAAFPSLVAVYVAYWVGASLYGPRYFYESLPGLAVVSAAGLAWLAGWLRREARPAAWRAALAGGALLVLLGLNIADYLPPRLAMMRDLYGMSPAKMLPLEEARLGRALVIVHAVPDWTSYGTLLTLTPPFREGDLLLAFSRGTSADAQLARDFAGWPVYFYYTDRPDVIEAGP
jgi:hypothetical protein